MYLLGCDDRALGPNGAGKGLRVVTEAAVPVGAAAATPKSLSFWAQAPAAATTTTANAMTRTPSASSPVATMPITMPAVALSRPPYR
jgi:hypothetical protein